MRLDFAQRAWYDKKYTGGYRSYRNLHSIKQEHRVTNGSPVRVRYWPATVMRRGRQPCATSRETSYRFDADDFSGNRNLHPYEEERPVKAHAMCGYRENPQGSEIIAAGFGASEMQNICRLSEKGRSVFLQTSLLPGENRADRRNFCHYSGISRSGMPGMMSLHSDLQP